MPGSRVTVRHRLDWTATAEVMVRGGERAAEVCRLCAEACRRMAA